MKFQAAALVLSFAGAVLAVPTGKISTEKRIFPWPPPEVGSDRPEPTPALPSFSFSGPTEVLESSEINSLSIPELENEEGGQGISGIRKFPLLLLLSRLSGEQGVAAEAPEEVS